MEYPASPSTSSTSSLSAPASPAASLHPPPPPTLSRLIQHFATAKQSLSSASYVSRASELVGSSRILVEEIAILNARNVYLRRGVAEGVGVLAEVKTQIDAAGEAAGEEFREVLEGLDRADLRLQRTLDGLRATLVHSSLQKELDHGNPLEETSQELYSDDRVSTTDEASQAQPRSTLYDFLDPAPHLNLRTSLRADIDAFHASRDDLHRSIELFSTSLLTINTTLARGDDDKVPEKRTLYDTEPPPTVRVLFEGIEEHAGALAELLQGLVNHYDLCVSALKHVEGGGEAARDAVQPTGLGGSNDGEQVEESLFLRKKPLPIDDEEWQDMLAVLERDAAELEDVVAEISDRAAEQESLHDQLFGMVKKSRNRDAILRETVTMLREMRELLLPSHLHALRTFTAEWDRLRSSMASKTTELLDLAASNEAFIAAYAELLNEIERREGVKREMRVVAEEATKELRRLSELDKVARRKFVEGFGGNLPRGIWDGDMEGERGVRWEVKEVRM